MLFRTKRMDIKTILFDLDGTLTDSVEGIMNAVRYTLERYEKTATEAQLRSFIGPPLQTQFQQFLNVSEEEGKRAVSIYREYYTERGIFENKVYAGVIGLLEQLKASGFRICMATSKQMCIRDRRCTVCEKSVIFKDTFM